MKLPEIKYSTNVRPLTQISPFQPVKDAATNIATLQSSSDIVDTIGGIYTGIQKDKAVEFSGAAAARMAEAQAEAETHPEPLERPNILRERAKEIDDEAKENLSHEAYQFFQPKFTNKTSELVNRYTIDSAIKANKVQRDNFVDTLDKVAMSGDMESAKDMIDEATMFSDSEKDALYENVHLKREIGAIEKIKYSGDPIAIASALENIMSDAYDGVLQGNKREAAIADLKSAYKSATAEAEAEREHREGRMWGDLKLAVSNGEAGMMDIEKAYDEYPDVINESRRAELMMLHSKVNEERTKNANMIQLVDWSLANGEPLNNKNKDHNKAVNAYYEKNPTFELGIELAAKTNIMPDLMEDEFRRLPFLGKPEKVLKLANSYEILERESPLSLENVGTKQAAVLGTVSSLYRGGVPIAEAVDIARENASKPPEEQQVLVNQYRGLTREKPSFDRLNSHMDSDDRFDISIGLGGAPDAPAALRSSFSALEMEYYKYTGGDLDMASKLAFQHVARVFSGTEINGKDQVFAYTPERVTGLPVKFLRKDLKKQAKDYGLDPEKVMIVPDANTAREKGIKSYPIYVIDRFDNPVPTEYRWTPDVGRYNNQRLDEAKKERINRMGHLDAQP